MTLYSKVTMNLVGAKKRYETMDGIQYLVVPAVMLTEGVHAGTQGPLLYQSGDMSKNPVTWNHKPVVLYHPTLNGEGISACDPAVVESQRTGLLFNTNWDGRLRTECWLMEDKLKRISPGTLDCINNGKMVEVSTGLYHDLEAKKGEWNGESYDGIVRNIQGDHLAILPDQVGACSIADGAGLLRNAELKDAGLSFDDVRIQMQGLLRDDRKSTSPSYCSEYCWVCDVYSKFAVYESDGGKYYKVGYKVKTGKVVLDGEPEEVRKVTSYVTANKDSIQLNGRVYVTMSGTIVSNDDGGPVAIPKPDASQLSDIMRRNQMQKALAEKYSDATVKDDWGGWVTELLADQVVWFKDGKLFRLPYTYDNDKIKFSGDAEEVESSYVPRRTVRQDGNNSPYNVNSSGDNNMAVKPTVNVISEVKDLGAEKGKGDSQTRTTGRENEVNKMISEGHMAEGDRKWLMDLPDDGWSKVSGFVLKGAKQDTVPYGYAGIGDRSNVHANPAAQNQAVMNEAQYIEAMQAPPSVKEMLLSGLQLQAQEKVRLVKSIVANKSNMFSEEFLMLKGVPELRGIAALCGQSKQTANYGGQADPGIPMFAGNQGGYYQQTVTDNAPAPDVLPIPTWNWGKETG